jgi:DsbC/DsbD-like thiol-disulfide interchange protein
MAMIRTALGATVVGALVALAAAGDRALVRTSLASPWVELGSARVRLVAGGPADTSRKSFLAGVEVTLDEGWKTYWRMPGDAGVPPNFEWKGSTNAAKIAVHFPAPTRMQEAGAQTIGYKKAVTFPVEVVPGDPTAPVRLELKLELGICREICIPAEAALALTLQPSELQGAAAPAALAALERVPRPQAGRRSEDPKLERVATDLDRQRPRLVIEARFPRGQAGADAFIEAPDGIYLPMPQRVADGVDGILRFEVDLSRSDVSRELAGKTLRVTLVGDSGATEASWALP